MSLRTRLILSYVLVVVLCLGIAALSVSLVLRSYRDQLVTARLDYLTRPVVTQIRSLVRGQTSLVNVWNAVQQEAQTNNVFILLVDENGNLVRQASPDNTSQQLNVPGGLPHGFTQDAHGVFTASGGQNFVYVAFTLGRTAQQPGQIENVVLCQPQVGVGVILAGVITPFIWAGIIALAVSLLLAFLVARSVYRPVQRLSRAAENISQGNFEAAVPVSGPPEVKRLAANFNIMAQQVKESQQYLRHFVADVSHQLRSPLTSIQGFAQAILDGTAADPATRDRAAAIIVEESNRMLRQVNELLELSRLQAGQLKLAREGVDLKDILQRCQEIFALRLEEKKISVVARIDSLPPVTGDADRLEDVFCNLLDNAIKNTPEGGKIEITTAGVEHSVSIAVEDNGPGIPPEQLPHVFDRFQQSGGLRTGFGLGLAIAREIVLAHGGKIEVASPPGQGARFTVTLPVTPNS